MNFFYRLYHQLGEGHIPKDEMARKGQDYKEPPYFTELMDINGLPHRTWLRGNAIRDIFPAPATASSSST